MTTRGVIYVHSAPAALTPHLEWAVADVLDLGVPDRTSGRTDAEAARGSAFAWTRQPAEPGSMRAELAWGGAPGTGSRLASALRGWPRLRFEVTEESSPGNEGERYAWTPRLGMFSATIGVHGDIQVSEDRLRAAMAKATADGADMFETVESLLGQPWDEELEPFRYAGDGAPVRVLHHVV